MPPKRPVQAANKVKKITEDLSAKCQADTPNLRTVNLKKVELEKEWVKFDTLYDQWAAEEDEAQIEQHSDAYDTLTSKKDQALESAQELLLAEETLTQSQELSGTV